MTIRVTYSRDSGALKAPGWPVHKSIYTHRMEMSLNFSKDFTNLWLLWKQQVLKSKKHKLSLTFFCKSCRNCIGRGWDTLTFNACMSQTLKHCSFIPYSALNWSFVHFLVQLFFKISSLHEFFVIKSLKHQMYFIRPDKATSKAQNASFNDFHRQRCEVEVSKRTTKISGIPL